MLKWFMGAIGLMLIAGPNNAWATDCEPLLRMHGFASRAQFECGFSRYSQDILNQARQCSGVLGEMRVKDNLTRGMVMFDDRVKNEGKAAACAEVLEKLPGVVGH